MKVKLDQDDTYELINKIWELRKNRVPNIANRHNGEGLGPLMFDTYKAVGYRTACYDICDLISQVMLGQNIDWEHNDKERFNKIYE